MILLHAQLASKAQRRLEDVFSNGHWNYDSSTSPLRLHMLILSSYVDNWRWYMDELGSTCLRLVSFRMQKAGPRSLSNLLGK